MNQPQHKSISANHFSLHAPMAWLWFKWTAVATRTYQRAGKLRAALRGLPAPVKYGVSGYFALIVFLSGLSFSIGTVLMQTDVQTIALAKPATMTRTIRQADVAQFGTKVSSAFGVQGDVVHEFADWILEASERQLIAPELLASLVVTESSFRKIARSNVGAIGPTQVRPDYWGSFAVILT